MIGIVTRVAGSVVYVRLADYPGKELRGRAVVHRISASPEAFSTYENGDAVQVVDDGEGGLLVIGVVR